MMAWLETLEARGDISLNDWSNAIQSPERYYNLDHLNLSGIEEFVGQYLRPMLDAEDTKVRGVDGVRLR
jgi:hypothetical protein